MNGTRHTLCAALVMISIAAVASDGMALEANEQFSLTVSAAEDKTQSNCHVVNKVGVQEYTIQAPQGKEIDVESVKWSGPPGAGQMDGSLTASFTTFNSDDCDYTVTVTGKFKGTQGLPGDGFSAKFKGAVYKPMFVATDPTSDQWLPAKKSHTLTFKAEFKAKYGNQYETEWARDMLYEAQICTSGGGEADGAKAHLGGRPGETSINGCLDEDGKLQETWVVTTDALAGEEYYMTVAIAEGEYLPAADSKKAKLYGVTIESVSPEWVGLENPAQGTPWTGTLANDVTFNLKIVPSTYTDASGGKVEVYDPTGDPTETVQLTATISGETGTAKLPQGQAVQVGQYKAKAFLHHDDDEKETSSDLKPFDTFAVDISNPSNSKVITEKNSGIDFEAVHEPSGSPAGTLSWEGGSSVGGFASDDWTTVFNTSSLGVANVWAEYTIGGSTAKSNKVEITVAEADLDIYPGGSDLDIGEENRALPGSPVADSIEESEGAYLLVNWDDDDNDGGANGTPVPDLSEQSSPVTITGEDNLARIDLKLDPNPTAGTVSLSFPSGSSKIVVWTHATKGTKVTDLEWNIDNGETVPSTLWLEGVAASSSQRDVTAALSWSKGTSSVSDTVKATVVMIRLGNAVYREMAAPHQAAGHSGVIRKFLGTCTRADIDDPAKYEVLEMQGDPDAPVAAPLTSFLPGTPSYWGTYTSLVVSRSHVNRLKVMVWAKGIWDRRAQIKYEWNDVMLPCPWNGTITGINEMRCDGLVEAVYEGPGFQAWGKIVGGVTNYCLKSFTSQHNEFNILTWESHMMPATQCGHERTHMGTKWDTRFSLQPLYAPNIGGTLR